MADSGSELRRSLGFCGNRMESESFPLFIVVLLKLIRLRPARIRVLLRWKKYILSAALAIASLTFGGIYAATSDVASSQNRITTEQCHTHAEGQHCRGTVGCDCRGFSPINNGKEWQKEYCRHCGHKKSYHRWWLVSWSISYPFILILRIHNQSDAIFYFSRLPDRRWSGSRICFPSQSTDDRDRQSGAVFHCRSDFFF